MEVRSGRGQSVPANATVVTTAGVVAVVSVETTFPTLVKKSQALEESGRRGGFGGGHGLDGGRPVKSIGKDKY